MSAAESALLALCTLSIGDPVDWPDAGAQDFYQAFAALAEHHGVDALVCHTLQNSPEWESVPEAARLPLLDGLRRNTALEMVRRRDLEELLPSLSQAGLHPVLLKGGALAYTHYPEPWLRPRVDADLFIAGEDIQRAKRVFEDLGYRLVGRTYKSHQFNCVRDAFGGNVVNYDVHWRSANHARLARVISHAEAIDESMAIPGLPGGWGLKPWLALLQACMHRVGNPAHDGDRLIWLMDMHLLLTEMSSDEKEAFGERAVREGLQSVCLEGLQRCQACLGTELPESLVNMLSGETSGKVSKAQRIRHSHLGLILDDLRELPSTADRAALVREYIAPSSEYLLERYGKQGRQWVPLLYLRYLASGFYDRILLR